MEFLLTDIFVVVLLIILNGFFAGAEIAIISIRKGRLKSLVEDGSKQAKIISNFHADPNRFFATVQIGVTLVSTVASAFGGAELVEKLGPIIAQVDIGFIQNFSEEIAFGLVVLTITYLSLVIGELVPKSLALTHSEGYSMMVAYPLSLVSKIFFLFTRLLTFSSNLILKPFRDKTSFSETKLLTEEIHHLLEEGVKSGTLESSEHEIIENVLEFNETVAREIMVPRVEIKAIDAEATEGEIKTAFDFYFSRIPVCKDGLDNVIGILHLKDIMKATSHGKPFRVTEITRPVYYVPESMKIGHILKEMQKRKTHMAIVVDEFGGTSGLLTMEDILEEIVGEIQDATEHPDEHDITPLPDGSHYVTGSCAISDFNEYFNSNIREGESYTSVAGYILEQVGRFPEVGEKHIVGDITFELVKRSKQKMVQFRVTKKPNEKQTDD